MHRPGGCLHRRRERLIVLEAVQRWRPLLVVANLAVVSILLLLGTLHEFADLPLTAFDLDTERNVPTAYSALILGGAMLLALGLALGPEEREAPSRNAALGIAAFFAYMALDEMAFIHERVELALDVRWPIAYLPVTLLGALAWLAVLRGFRTSPLALACWVGGAIAWTLVPLLELYGDRYPDGSVLAAAKMVIIAEEGLEMIGSSLFAIALLLAFSVAIGTGSGQAGDSRPAARVRA